LTELMNKIVSGRPAEPIRIKEDFPHPLQRILAKMLRKNPKKRYLDGIEIIKDINDFLNGKSRKTLSDRIRDFFHCDWS